MVLAWNFVIVGLAQAPAGSPVESIDTIKLRSFSSQAVPVVHALASAVLGPYANSIRLQTVLDNVDKLTLSFPQQCD